MLLNWFISVMYTGVFIFFIGSQRLIYLPKCHRHIWIQNYVTQRPLSWGVNFWCYRKCGNGSSFWANWGSGQVAILEKWRWIGLVWPVIAGRPNANSGSTFKNGMAIMAFVRYLEKEHTTYWPEENCQAFLHWLKISERKPTVVLKKYKLL